MIVSSAPARSSNVTITLSEEEAAKLRRACNFNVTIKDRVSANSGDRDGWSMYHLLDELGNKLKSQGIKRWKRS